MDCWRCCFASKMQAEFKMHFAERTETIGMGAYTTSSCASVSGELRCTVYTSLCASNVAPVKLDFSTLLTTPAIASDP